MKFQGKADGQILHKVRDRKIRRFCYSSADLLATVLNIVGAFHNVRRFMLI